MEQVFDWVRIGIGVALGAYALLTWRRSWRRARQEQQERNATYERIAARTREVIDQRQSASK